MNWPVPDPSARRRWCLLLGLLESAATYVLVSMAATLMHRCGLRLPDRIEDQYPIVVALLGVTASLLVGRLHQRRGRERRAAGVYAGTAIWPIVTGLGFVCYFAMILIGWGIHSE